MLRRRQRRQVEEGVEVEVGEAEEGVEAEYGDSEMDLGFIVSEIIYGLVLW